MEPQLPLYALSQGEPLAVIGYGIIQAKQVKFTGLSASESSLAGCQITSKNGLPETWELTLEKWHNSLILIANEIKNGQAVVFFHHRNAQQYGAALEPLNRWPERERLSPLLPAETGLTTPTGESQP